MADRWRAKIVAIVKTKMQLVLRKISPWKWTNLQKMDVCQILNWILSFRKFEETPHTQKYEKTCLRKKQNGREPNDRSCRGKPSIAKENQRGINAEKSQATKRVRKYNNKIRRTDGGERDPHRAFIEYVGHRPNRPKVITFLKTSTWVQLTAQNPMPGTRWFQL